MTPANKRSFTTNPRNGRVAANLFLTEFEAKYSKNEIELLAIVLAIELFKSYVYGVQFIVVSDHKVVSSVLKPNRAGE